MNSVLTQEQRNELARSDFVYQSHFSGTPRGDFKLAARTGGLDHLYAEHVAHEEELAAAEKAAQKAKNSAWRAKNLPKLAQAKAAREQTEANQKIAAVRCAKDDAGRRASERAVINLIDTAPSVEAPTKIDKSYGSAWANGFAAANGYDHEEA